MNPLIVFHDPCPDGTTAAWVAHKALSKQDPTLWPAQYKTRPPIPESVGRDVYLLDFCYPADAMAALVDASASVTVIDHHESNRIMLESLGQRITKSFSLDHSGGMLAWLWFRGDEPPPIIVRYTEDRDLYHWRLPNSRAVNAFIDSITTLGDMESWESAHQLISKMPINLAVSDGAAILRTQSRMVEQVCKNARDIVLAGECVRAANCSCKSLTSEVALQLAEDRPFGVSWYFRGDGCFEVSLRTKRSDVNVAAIAALFGGGGHRVAAGFEIASDQHPVFKEESHVGMAVQSHLSGCRSHRELSTA